ncbi:MAG: pitrilysin family protein [Bacteroidales bacterium]|nr:pitrilysin family protein [Bacteroidales bacterium]
MKNNIDFVIPSLVPYTTVLDNGLKVHAFKNHSMDVVRMEFYFENAGTMNQDKVFSSLVANNLITEGSRGHSAKEIADKIDFYGAFIERSLDKETASVSFYFLKKYKEDLIPWFEEIIKDPDFPQTEMEVYLRRLKQQRLVNEKKTNYLARVNFFQCLFGEMHPFGLVGSMEDYDLLNRKDLFDFYNSFYSYERCSIIIAGDIDDRLIGLLNKSFGSKDWKKDGVLDVKCLTYMDNSNVRRSISLESAVQSSVRIGCTTISANHVDYMGLNVVSTLLGGYFGSRLMSNIREDKGYTYGIGSSLLSFKDIGLFYISAEIKQENCQDAINEIYNEIEVLKSKRVTDEELHRVKNFMKGTMLRSLDGSFELSDNFRSILKFGLDYDYFHNYLRVISEIDSDEVLRLAQSYFNVNQMVEIRVGDATLTN